MNYYFEKQYSEDGETWITIERMTYLPPFFELHTPANKLTRYVEYNQFGNDPLVMVIGENYGQSVKWTRVNVPRKRIALR